MGKKKLRNDENQLSLDSVLEKQSVQKEKRLLKKVKKNHSSEVVGSPDNNPEVIDYTPPLEIPSEEELNPDSSEVKSVTVQSVLQRIQEKRVKKNKKPISEELMNKYINSSTGVETSDLKPSETIQEDKLSIAKQVPETSYENICDEIIEFARRYGKLELITDLKTSWVQIHAKESNAFLNKIPNGTGIFVKFEKGEGQSGQYFCKRMSLGQTITQEFMYLNNKTKYEMIDETWDWIMAQLTDLSETIQKKVSLRYIERLKELEASGELASGKVIENLDEYAYHHGPGVSNSMLGELRKSCAHLDAHEIRDEDEEEARYFVLGRAFHDYNLRNEIFEKTTMIIPKKKYSKAGLFLQKIQALEGVGLNVITEKEFEAFKKCRKQMEKHPLFNLVLSEGKNEVSAYHKLEVMDRELDKSYSILSRVRFDKIIENPSQELKDLIERDYGKTGDYVVIADLKYLKGNSDIDDEAARAFLNFGYHRADSYYSAVAERVFGKSAVFIFLTVSKDKVHDCIPYCLGDDFKELGDQENYDLIKEYATNFMENKPKSIDDPTWRGRSTKIITLAAPTYAIHRAIKRNPGLIGLDKNEDLS